MRAWNRPVSARGRLTSLGTHQRPFMWPLQQGRAWLRGRGNGGSHRDLLWRLEATFRGGPTPHQQCPLCPLPWPSPNHKSLGTQLASDFAAVGKCSAKVLSTHPGGALLEAQIPRPTFREPDAFDPGWGPARTVGTQRTLLCWSNFPPLRVGGGTLSSPGLSPHPGLRQLLRTSLLEWKYGPSGNA